MENEKQKKVSKNQKLLLGYFLLVTLDGLGGGIYLLAIPSDPKNQWLFGYSLSRLVLLAVFVVFLTVSFWLALHTWRNMLWGEQILKSITSSKLKSWLLGLSGFGLLLVVTILITPLYRFRSWVSHVERLYPFIWYFFFFFLQTLSCLVYQEWNIYRRRFIYILKQNRSGVLVSVLILLGMLVLWMFIAFTRIGVQGDGGLWGEAGVPLLPEQILAMLVIIIAWYMLEFYLDRTKIFSTSKHLDWLIRQSDIVVSLAIWLVTFLLWTHPLFQKSFFFPGPYPPSGEYFPFADAATWDIFGQFALIGQGFANGNAFANHIALSGFEAILHLLVGQDYARLITLQVAFYAMFPVVLYWLGKHFHGNKTGFFLAGLISVHEMNAFASSNMINLSHAKLMLTEFPTGLGLAVVSLWLFLWFRNNPDKNKAYALPIGGLLAILILLRFNSLVMPFALFVGIVLIFRKNWISALASVLLLLLTIMVVLSPWMWRSWKIRGTPLFFFNGASLILDSDFRINSIPELDETSLPSFGMKSDAPEYLSVAHSLEKRQIKRSLYFISPRSGTLVLTILNHFVHNLVTSVLILPTTPFLHDLRHTIYEVSPYWNKFEVPWLGVLTFSQRFWLFVHLGFLSVGISTSWRKWQLAGLVPLGVHITYNLSTALARTSGGRYVVPVNWVVIFYFSLGVMHLVSLSKGLFGESFNSKFLFLAKSAFSYKEGILYLLPIFIFVCAITVIDQVVPQRYPFLKKDEVFEKIVEMDLLGQTNISQQELRKFLKDPKARAFWGISMFPRYYDAGQGESTFAKTAYSSEEFPHLGFQFIGPFGIGEAVLPLSQPPQYFPHAEDIIVIGCEREKNDFVQLLLDAVMVIVFDSNDRVFVYVRDQEIQLQCLPSSK